jgi:hypothetical protein
LSHRSRRWGALVAILLAAALTACGGSSASPPAPAASAAPASSAPASPNATAALTCPTAARVGAALGITLPSPFAPAGGGALPTGAKAIACDYHAQFYNVIIEIITNIDPTYISHFSVHFPVPFTNVPGVGDQARSFSVSIGGGKVNEGVVATKGSTLISIDVTAAPTSLAQIEALLNQLL